MWIVRAVMARVVGIEMLALVMRAWAAPMANALCVMRRRGRDKAAAAMAGVMLALMKEGGGWRRPEQCGATHKSADEHELSKLLHVQLSPKLPGETESFLGLRQS